jgi:hypothetical protein
MRAIGLLAQRFEQPRFFSWRDQRGKQNDVRSIQAKGFDSQLNRLNDLNFGAESVADDVPDGGGQCGVRGNREDNHGFHVLAGNFRTARTSRDA